MMFEQRKEMRIDISVGQDYHLGVIVGIFEDEPGVV